MKQEDNCAQDSFTSFQSISLITSDEEIFSDMEQDSNSDISNEDEEDKSAIPKDENKGDEMIL